MDSSAVFNTSWLCTVPIRFLRTWRLAATAEPLSVRKSLRSRRLVVSNRKWVLMSCNSSGEAICKIARNIGNHRKNQGVICIMVASSRVAFQATACDLCRHDEHHVYTMEVRNVFTFTRFCLCAARKHSNDLNTFNSSRLSDSNSLLALNLFCSRHVGWDVVWLVLKRPHTFPPLLAKAFSKWSILTNWHSDGSGMIW